MWRFFGLLFLLFMACNSPEQRFRRLQRDFLKEFPRTGTYLIVEKGDTLALSLPPARSDVDRIRQRVADFQERCKAMDVNTLPLVEQRRYVLLSALLDSLSQPDRQSGPDLAQFCQNKALQQLLSPGELVRRQGLLTVFVEKLPDYYAKVEECWPLYKAAHVADDDGCSVEALDQLDRLEANLSALSAPHRERLQKALNPARHAIKDFIGRCRSSVLE